METVSVPSPINLNVILLALLFATVVYLGVSDKKMPLLSNIRVDIVLLVIIGMTICSQGGIGRIAATGQWSHPLQLLVTF